MKRFKSYLVNPFTQTIFDGGHVSETKIRHATRPPVDCLQRAKFELNVQVIPGLPDRVRDKNDVKSRRYDTPAYACV